MYLLQPLTRDALFEQVFKDMFDLIGAANHADITGVGFECGTQGVLVEMVPACDDDDPACLIRLQVANGLGNVTEAQLYFLAKDLRVSQVTAIIYHHYTKVKLGCQPRQGLGNVAGTCDDQPRFGAQHLNEHLKGRAATPYGLPLVGIQVEMANIAASFLE